MRSAVTGRDGALPTLLRKSAEHHEVLRRGAGRVKNGVGSLSQR